MSTATIRADDLTLLLASAKLRKWTQGRTCLLAAMSQVPVLDCDCHNGRRPQPEWIEQSRRMGPSRCRITPISRGHIKHLFERVARERGRREVLSTWGVGIRALRAEPAYVLFGGRAS